MLLLGGRVMKPLHRVLAVAVLALASFVLAPAHTTTGTRFEDKRGYVQGVPGCAPGGIARH
jgi:hypothetical protein